MTKLKKLFARRTKTEDKELEEFRQLLEVPDTFEDGFSLASFIGSLFVALVMVPGSLYMSLVAGMGIGGAAQWVTVLLFVEVAKRANAKLSRAQLFILFYMSGLVMTQAVSPLFTQFLVRSDAAVTSGVANLIPAWVAPANLDKAPRSFLTKAWMPAIGLIVFQQIMDRISSAILGYGLFRLTSDIERLPFPMAPIGAQGILAVAEQVDGSAKSAGTSVRWRMFCIGTGIGMIFGLIYMAVPTLSGAFFDETLMIFKIPFADFTPYTQNFLPATATGFSFDLGNVVLGMTMPFFSMLGSFVGLIFTFVMNPILYNMGMMQTWERGDTTVLTLFANNIDFYFSFQIGISLAIALYGIVLSVKNIRRSQSKQNTKTQNYKHSLEDLSKKRGHMPSWLFLITYLISCTGYIVVSGFLIGWHPGVMIVLFFFGFIYTPLISYVTARLEGMAG
ncbi:MAG: hypothetical protein GX804_00190 [Lentisphaerae bacterium]|nr:hypothetical protein [Lentisphaerota bacterium]